MALFVHCCFGMWKFKGEWLYGELRKVLLIHEKCMDFVKPLVFVKLWICLFSFHGRKVIYESLARVSAWMLVCFRKLGKENQNR